MPPCDVPPEAQTFLFGARKLLLVLHGLASLALLGSSTHHALQMPALLRGKTRVRLERIYARVVAVAYLTVYTLGALIYPTYRYHVRALYFDRYHPALSNLFDIKENLATISLLLAVALGVMGGRLGGDPEDKALLPIYASMSVMVALTVWFNVVSGLLLVSYKSV